MCVIKLCGYLILITIVYLSLLFQSVVIEVGKAEKPRNHLKVLFVCNTCDVRYLIMDTNILNIIITVNNT